MYCPFIRLPLEETHTHIQSHLSIYHPKTSSRTICSLLGNIFCVPFFKIDHRKATARFNMYRTLSLALTNTNINYLRRNTTILDLSEVSFCMVLHVTSLLNIFSGYTTSTSVRFESPQKKHTVDIIGFFGVTF